MATVYRNLDSLVKSKILLKIDFGHGKSKYEFAEEYNNMGHHHHLLCELCEEVMDYNKFIADELSYVNSMESKLSKEYGYKITNHVIRFIGTCKKCTKKMSK